MRPRHTVPSRPVQARVWSSGTGEPLQELPSARGKPFLAFKAFGQGCLAGVLDGAVKLYRSASQ